jgi:hypothetical protein
MEYLVRFKQKVTREEDNYITISAESEEEANKKVLSQDFIGLVQPTKIDVIDHSKPEIIDSINVTGFGELFQSFLSSAYALCKDPIGNTFTISGVDPKMLEYVKAKFGDRYYNDYTFKIGGNSIILDPKLDINDID